MTSSGHISEYSALSFTCPHPEFAGELQRPARPNLAPWSTIVFFYNLVVFALKEFFYFIFFFANFFERSTCQIPRHGKI